MSFPQPCLFIDGEWLSATDEGSIAVVNPADGQTLAHLPVAGIRELRAAVAAAGRGFAR